MPSISSAHLDYFPIELLEELAQSKEDINLIEDKKTQVHTNALYDTSLISSGMYLIVRRTNKVGMVTTYHETTIGQINGGIEIKFADDSTEIYYPNQLKLSIK
ncbi:MAG: hypothetical protein ACRDBG_17125 [Waterburya sp.]